MTPARGTLTSGVRDRVGRFSLRVGDPAPFEGRVGDNPHHVACRPYGVVADAGRVAGGAEATVWGLCPAVPPPQFPSTVIRLVRKDFHV